MTKWNYLLFHISGPCISGTGRRATTSNDSKPPSSRVHWIPKPGSSLWLSTNPDHGWFRARRIKPSKSTKRMKPPPKKVIPSTGSPIFSRGRDTERASERSLCSSYYLAIYNWQPWSIDFFLLIFGYIYIYTICANPVALKKKNTTLKCRKNGWYFSVKLCLYTHTHILKSL